ncbi:TrmB family transcriptional regulator [Candidatus Woesearchaeota archaeon]|nr:TrmB family transcriptional regulator [Candidatus Woesearchaeota archaeon]
MAGLYDLLKIGLTEGESKVYLALTELGSSTVGPIVKKAKVAYSNVYDILQRLMEKGIVSYIIKGKTKYFQAASPSNLVDYLEKKEKEIASQKESLRNVLPALKKLQGLKEETKAEIFTGFKGLKTAYEKLLAGGGELLFFYIHEEQYAKKSDLFYFSIKDLLKKKKIRGISNEKGRKSEVTKKMAFLNCKFAKFPIPGNMEVCGDKLMLVAWEKPLTATLIYSKSIADNFRRYFNSVWKIAKD